VRGRICRSPHIGDPADIECKHDKRNGVCKHGERCLYNFPNATGGAASSGCAPAPLDTG
jgi:hypothetical protein